MNNDLQEAFLHIGAEATTHIVSQGLPVIPPLDALREIQEALETQANEIVNLAQGLDRTENVYVDLDKRITAIESAPVYEPLAPVPVKDWTSEIDSKVRPIESLFSNEVKARNKADDELLKKSVNLFHDVKEHANALHIDAITYVDSHRHPANYRSRLGIYLSFAALAASNLGTFLYFLLK